MEESLLNFFFINPTKIGAAAFDLTVLATITSLYPVNLSSSAKQNFRFYEDLCRRKTYISL